MRALLLLLLAFALPALADWGKAVYELTTADETSDILDDNAMIFVLYRDTSHPDDPTFHEAFVNVATEFMHESPAGALHLQWFSVDTLLYPSMEDPRTDRAIFDEQGHQKSKLTGRPQGAYVTVLYQGQ